MLYLALRNITILIVITRAFARDLYDAQRLRQMVEDVMKQKGAIDEETEAWARFVREEADRLDPVFDNRFLEVMTMRLEDFGDEEASIFYPIADIFEKFIAMLGPEPEDDDDRQRGN